MKLQDIGFYTLDDTRAKESSAISPMHRLEILLTDKCNFSCKYCRGPREDCIGEIPLEKAINILEEWAVYGLKNVRFSGGEPTMYEGLSQLVKRAKELGVEHIAISTNGSANIDVYDHLIKLGVNDFSISLDACCASFANKMAGTTGVFKKLVQNIKFIAKRTYVTVGCVFTEENIHTVADVVKFAHGLGVADIRIISSAQYNQGLSKIEEISEEILNAHPILKYRVNNIKNGVPIRGLQEGDAKCCYLTLDDAAIAGNYHFPCIIYLREGGKPIGELSDGKTMRIEREKWALEHNTLEDPICSSNCLDVCRFYCNKAKELRKI